MTLEIPRRWAAMLVVFAVAAIVLLLVMTARFGGTSIRLDDPYDLRVSVAEPSNQEYTAHAPRWPQRAGAGAQPC